MKLASRMDRILIETAFEVLVRARALEAKGRSIIHLEIGEPDFERRRISSKPARRRSTRAGPTTGPRRAIPNCAKRSPPHVSARAASGWVRRTSASCPAASRSSSSPCWRCSKRATRSSTPIPGFPDLRIDDPLSRRRRRADAARRRARLLLRLESAAIEDSTDRTKMLMLNSPQNPTGGVIPREDIAAHRRTACATAT